MIQPDCLLIAESVYEAGHTLFSLAYADEWEEAGYKPCRGELCAWAPRQPEEAILPIMWYLIGRVEQVWCQSVGLVFHHAGILTAEQQERALSDLLLGCHGHGVSLSDDFEEEIGSAESVLGKVFKISPFYDEGYYWRELAREAMEREGYTPRGYGEEE